MARISDANPLLTIEGDELLLVQEAAGDAKITVDQLSSKVRQDTTPAEVLNKVIAANPASNGLNAQFLQNFTLAALRNASNLNTGTVQNARLPNGDYETYHAAGGAYFDTGAFGLAWEIPDFIGPFSVQFGYSIFTEFNRDLGIQFKTPFGAGFGPENKPIVFVTPECRSSEWDQWRTSVDPQANVELTAMLWYTDLTSFKVSTRRFGGALVDHVRANWFAIGFK